MGVRLAVGVAVTVTVFGGKTGVRAIGGVANADTLGRISVYEAFAPVSPPGFVPKIRINRSTLCTQPRFSLMYLT